MLFKNIFFDKIHFYSFFLASLVPNAGLFSGKIVIKSKNSQFKVQIPYRAFLLRGQLEVAPNVTHFHMTSKEKFFQRPLTVTNEFDRPVAVHNLSLASEAMRFFHMEGSVFGPVILKPGETKDLIKLSLSKEAWEEKILNSYLTIHTNISSINVPLICFHGMVETVSKIFFFLRTSFISARFL